MRHSPDVSLGRAATLLLVFVSLPLFSCLKLESTACPSGLTCPSGMICATQQDICIDESPSCGDGTVQASVGEACDDGNILDGDGCSKDCKSDERCGNGRVDKEEVCDFGDTLGGDGCSADCKSLERCGNGIVDTDADEVCDFGDTVDGDGCSANCRSTERCGNNIIDLAVGEFCDDGDAEGGDGCSADCRSGEGCDNNILDKGEQCDDGNGITSDECLYLHGRCVVARCGDGVTKTVPPAEECDDGGESPSCNADCTFSECGDGVVNVEDGEQCDPGVRDASTQTCTRECKLSRCGDGFLNEAAGEECDDGDRNGEGGCLRTCKRNLCGNGNLDQDRESCDDGNNQACGRCNATCSQYHFTKATGRISALPASDIQDGEAFSLSDGMNLPIVFEFDKWWGTSGSHIPVPIGGSPTVEQVATAIEAAINSPGNFHLRIKATRNGTFVDLEHKDPGAFGNQLIIHDVARPLQITGMSGGTGKDCPVGVGCRKTDDCARGLSCAAGLCQ